MENLNQENTSVSEGELKVRQSIRFNGFLSFAAYQPPALAALLSIYFGIDQSSYYHLAWLYGISATSILILSLSLIPKKDSKLLSINMILIYHLIAFLILFTILIFYFPYVRFAMLITTISAFVFNFSHGHYFIAIVLGISLTISYSIVSYLFPIPASISPADLQTINLAALIPTAMILCYFGFTLQRERNQSRLQKKKLEAIQSELNDSLEHIKEIADLDGLTTCFNRRAMTEKLEYEYLRTRRYQKGMALLLIDIDNFKSVNDSYGHDVGDEVLKTLGVILKGVVRKTDIVSRWGGEEFLMLFPETDAKSAIHTVNRMNRILEVLPFFGQITAGESTQFNITVSGGLVNVIPPAPLEDAIKAADILLYKAKENGRNQVLLNE